MLNTISNDYITLITDTFAAEKTSLKINGDSTEYIWQPAPQKWQRNGPLCFPVLGDFPNNTYIVGGKEYHNMTIHGFAMTSEFTVTEKGDDYITYQLLSSQKTLEIYPFDFKLLVKYRLVKNSVHVTFEVYNTGDKDMIYAVGAHPGFSCPLSDEDTFDDYYIEFEKPETLDKIEQYHSPISVIENVFGEENTILPLSYELFDKGAIAYKGLVSNTVSIKNKKNSRFVTMDITGFPYFALWTSRNNSFICLEPWHGMITLAKPDQHILEKRDAMSWLKPNEIFKCTHTITIG